MKNLIIFKNKEFGQIRTCVVDGETYFVGRDVASALGYKNSMDAMKRHVEEEDKAIVKHDTLQGKQQHTVINESGLYSLTNPTKAVTMRVDEDDRSMSEMGTLQRGMQSTIVINVVFQKSNENYFWNCS